MTHGRQLASCVARTRDLLAIVLVGIAVIAKPQAAPPENATSEFHDFFERQRIPGLDVRCCSVEDHVVTLSGHSRQGASWLCFYCCIVLQDRDWSSQ